jgi:hypothetical protein
MAVCLFATRKGRRRYTLALACLVPVGIALCLSVLQYVSVGNVSDFVSTMTNRYAGAYEPYRTTDAIRDLAYWYRVWHGQIYGAAVIFLAAAWLIRCATGRREPILDSSKRGPLVCTLLVLTVPVFVHHAMFLAWTAYHAQYFSTLKAVPFFAVCLGLSFWVLMYKTPTVSRGPLVLLATLILAWSAYASYDRYVKTFGYDISPYSYCEAGKKMAQVAYRDEVLFVKDYRLSRHNFPISPVFVYCAGRNIAIYTNETEARSLIQANGASGGVVFTLSYLDGAGVDIVQTEEIRK